MHEVDPLSFKKLPLYIIDKEFYDCKVALIYKYGYTSYKIFKLW
jgi:hypothetical protein